MFWDEIKHFKKSEFDCKCGCGKNGMDEMFIRRLDSLRSNCGFPFIVSSGYRCREHNDRVHGSPQSTHLLGLGCDILISSASKRLLFVDFSLSRMFRRIGIYPTFCHIDVAGIPQGKTSGIWWGE